MGILSHKKVVTLFDVFRLYETCVKSNYEEVKAYSIIAKTKTSIVRFVLPEYGFILKLDGSLLPSEMLEGLKFMEQISIYQVPHLLEVQEKVFAKFGDRVSPASRRVYRSPLKKMLEWGESQDWWKQSIGASPDSRTPTMLIFKKRVKHWHKLQPTEISPGLSQELEILSSYFMIVRRPCLNDSSCKRYRREVLGILGWMHRIKGIALTELSLTKLVPVISMYDQDAAEQVAVLAKEYLEWMRTNLGAKESTLKFALNAFLYVAEYMHYEYTKNFQEP